jgi:hypothetical protein
MKVLATLVLALSLPGLHFAASPQAAVIPKAAPQRANNGGQWYMAENGHAVYCRGPVMILTQPNGGLRRVATFCQGEKALVPLKD